MNGRGVAVDDDTRALVDGDELIDALGIDDAEIEWRKSFVRLEDEDEARMRALDSTFDDVADEVVDEFYDHLTSDPAATEIIGRSTKGVDQLKKTQTQYLRSLTDGEYGRDYFAQRARIGKIHEMLDMGPKFYMGAYSVYYDGLISAIGEDVKAEFGTDSTPGADATDEAATQSGVADGDTSGGNDGLLSQILGGAAEEADGRERRTETPAGETDTTSDVDAAVDAVVERASSLLKVLALDQQIAMDTYIHAYSEEARREAEHREELAREVKEDLREPIEDVSSASSVVAERSASIRDIAGDQAQDMEEVAAEVSQMSATVEEIAATAEDVEGTSGEAVSRARSGEEAADEAIDVMEEVADAANQASADLERLQSQIDEVDEVIEAIDEIAEQTNLLALNASIEAARAGEAGDGFAVVADEVKQLAEQSRERASDVEETVGRVQSDAADTIDSLAETTRKLHEGIDRGEDAMDSLDEIVDAVERTTEGIAEVATATDEQAVSAEEVTAMVETTRERSEEIADRVDDVAEASREQTERMDAIQQAADRLVNVDGDAAADDHGDAAMPPGVGADAGPPAGIDPADADGPPADVLANGDAPTGDADDGFAFVGTDGGVADDTDDGR
ncbi:globin-coupled sensor protein [Halobellus sp. Atlit-31R]|nr:globin-coupled sensor protein [Halobellus sp. Atlit-31R]